MKRTLWVVVFLACTPPPPEPSPFSVLTDALEGGALLGAHRDGEEVYFVGGDVDGGRGVIARYNGTRLCVEAEALERTLWWIHGDGAGEWYAVGDSGQILHEVNGVRTDESVATDAILYGVYMTGDRVFAVGGDVFGTGLGEIWMKENGVWSLFRGDIPRVIFKVWERWFVGEGVAFFLDENDQLEDRSPPDEVKLLTVVGRDNDDVFAVGGVAEPTMLHWESDAWVPVEVDRRCGLQPLNGVWTAPGEDVYVAGFFGLMGRYDGSTWECAREVTVEDFHVVYKDGDEVLFGGGNLFQQSGNHGAVAVFPAPERAALDVSLCP